MATKPFQFGFEGDDIDEDPAEKPPTSRTPDITRANEEPPQNDPKVHPLEDMVCENFITPCSFFSFETLTFFSLKKF